MRRAPGYTLIEILIYTFLFALILSGAIWVTRSFLETRGRVQNATLVEEQMRSALYQIGVRMRRASAITLPALGATSTNLILSTTDQAQNPIRFTFATGTVYLSQGTGASVALTPPALEVTQIVFTRLSGSPSDQVRVQLSAKARNAMGSYQAPFTLEQTFGIRR